MRMIAGLEEITRGDIRFDGESVIDKKPSQRNVSMAFETYALYPTLTVYENLAFPLRAAGMKGPAVDQRVREVGQIVGITELFERKPNHLSSGQSQSVGLARALIRKPNVFLLDEPISHLDTSQRFQMRMYLKRLHIDLGYTMILVTHDQEDAMSLADRVAVMSDGLLRQIDTPRNIYNHPADLFVAGFIGNLPMNFLECGLVRDGEKTCLQHDGIQIALPEAFEARVQRQDLPDQLVMGIRPYDLSVLNGHDGGLDAEIFVVEPLGDMNVVTVRIGETRFQVVAPTSYRAIPRTPVRISLDPAHILLFDKRTGKAL
jgi:ABC-type sugar transport system ATPase subunit